MSITDAPTPSRGMVLTRLPDGCWFLQSCPHLLHVVPAVSLSALGAASVALVGLHQLGLLGALLLGSGVHCPTCLLPPERSSAGGDSTGLVH